MKFKYEHLNVFKSLIVLGSFIVYFVADGVSLSFGIFTREFIEYFNENDREGLVFLTTGLLQAVPLFLSPLVCYLIEKFNCRPIALIGSTLVTLSFILTRYVVKNLLTLNLIVGIMLSCGLAMMYIPAYLIISYHFDKKRALATGIAVSGSGLGLFILSPISEYLIYEFGWMDACFLFGAISSHTFISACLFRPVEASKYEQEKNKTPTEKKTLIEEIKIICSNKQFLLVNFSYFILSFVIIAPYNFLPSHIKLKKFDDPNSISIAMIGLSTLIGQIVIGFVADYCKSFTWLVYSVCIILSGVITLVLPFLNNINYVFVYSFLFGFLTSVNYVLQSGLVIESLGIANLTLAFGFLQFSQGFSILMGSPMLGRLKDLTGDYDKSFYVSGFLMLFSGVALCLWPLLKGKKTKKSQSFFG
ncbi:unnamed protein product [Brachionus calyciflorus]|uniref:Uncharacterized protein n=1 Tax=Brachionus calyciflorus TaxID=104777 RepID=A0A813PDI2_9BILA|nr:unnamed protein product [Brachionus calyciflorus]